MSLIFYKVPEHSDEAFPLETGWELHGPNAEHCRRWAAEQAAADYHAEHDGWESGWPLTITLHDTEDGPEIARFKIDRELEPTFTATKETA